MDINRLRAILLDQRYDFFEEKDLIQRTGNFSPYMKTGQIVVITGVRRCGKSSLLWLLMRDMGLEEKNCFYLNGDDERLLSFTPDDFSNLLEIYRALFPQAEVGRCVYFFDEVQNLEGWEKFLTKLYENGHKIFVTGSNARLLSSEMATSLTGRYLKLSIQPFSFREYLRYQEHEPERSFFTTKEKGELFAFWEKYLELGGFPLVHKENNATLLQEYYQAILYRDIVARYRVNQVDELKQIGLFLFSNAGKLFSYKTLQEITGIGSLSTVKRFLEYWENAFMLFYVRKYDYSLKKQLLNSRKVYAVDTGLIRQIGFHFSEDRGRILKNQVFNSLQKTGSEIFGRGGEKLVTLLTVVMS